MTNASARGREQRWNRADKFRGYASEIREPLWCDKSFSELNWVIKLQINKCCADPGSLRRPAITVVFKLGN